MKAGVVDVFLVILQLAVFVAFVFDVHGWRLYFPAFLFPLAIVLLILGAAIIFFELMQLGKQLSPFPSPRKNSKLIVNGVYKYIRHPIYSGILIGFLALTMIADSGYKMLVTFLMFLLFYTKSVYEEKRLMQVFPDYKVYKNRTGRFFPKIKI
ncbi:MAG TPA: isoprenylcysteine carboxylmethyltransferase family protein [Flavobacteriaceae bacterium]|nr:isoprenylcysteine carboxylmethyltransferase family protein [Flavobacteriaceae bacterium]